MMTNEAETVATSATLTNFLPVHHPPPSALFCPPLLSFLRISQGGTGLVRDRKRRQKNPSKSTCSVGRGVHAPDERLHPATKHPHHPRDPWRTVHLHSGFENSLVSPESKPFQFSSQLFQNLKPETRRGIRGHQPPMVERRPLERRGSCFHRLTRLEHRLDVRL